MKMLYYTMKRIENDSFSSQHLLNQIFLGGAPIFTLIPPPCQFLKFSISFFYSWRIQQCINSMRRVKLRSCTEEFGRKSEKMLKLHATLPCVILRRHLSIHLCFAIRALIDRIVLITLANVYGTAFKVGGNQHYTDIMKQQGQSLRCLLLFIASIKEDNVIHAYEALEEHICLNGFEQQFIELLNYYDDTFIGRHHRTGCSQPFFPIRL
ncbi:LOW QUALITY PROTEIN: hypothetical protein HZS_4416 [Henneguya salminicola]|nr:LOW QUALITY PROTEIN: hypothetical protein HZS_4416 [Henneguya salminicola]